MKRKHGIAILLVILLLVLSACGGGSKDNAKSGGSSDSTSQGAASSNNASTNSGSSNSGGSNETVELRISWWGNAERAKLYDQILDLYESQNPHLKTIREWTSFNDYWPKLATQVAGGNVPDIFSLHVLLYGGDYGSKNVLEPLQPYVDQGLINLDDWDPAVVDAGKLDGVLYALPKGVTSSALIFNTTMIRNAGLDLPAEVGTLGEFKAYLQQLRDKLPQDQYPIIDASFDDHYIESYMRSKGKSFLSDDGTRLGFDKEDLKEFWNYWDEFRKLGLTVPVQLTVEYTGQPAENSLFAKQRIAIDLKPSNHGKIYSRNMPDVEINMLRTPSADNFQFKSGENLQAPSWVISNKSQHKEEAAKLINWFVNDVEAQKIYALENGIPGSKKIREALKPDLHPMDVEAIQHADTISPDLPPTDYRKEGASEVFTLYKKYLEQLAFERMTVDEAVDGFFQEAESVLKR